MPEPTPRKFTMGDLMILIAGCAFGIAWTKLFVEDVLRVYPDGASPEWMVRLALFVQCPAPIMTSIGLALLICRLRPPRPRRRRRFCQPGTVATACVTLVLAISATSWPVGQALHLLLDRIWPPPPSPGVISMNLSASFNVASSMAFAGLTITACWLLLLAVGRWKPEPSWIDRSGRFLGVGFILLYIATELTNALIS